MNTSVATKKPTDNKVSMLDCTSFQLHKSQLNIFDGCRRKIFDYTEHRLVRYAKTLKDEQQKLVINAMVADYKSGKIAIAWRSGQPISMKVTKDK